LAIRHPKENGQSKKQQSDDIYVNGKILLAMDSIVDGWEGIEAPLRTGG
jgi:hypothetical protein